MKKTALVTGATAGIGRACSIRLAGEGVRVGVMGRNPEECAAVVREIDEAGGQAIGLIGDITDAAQVQDCLARLRERFGPVTILVNNAGVTDFKPFEQLSVDDWRHVLEVNVIGTFIVTQACLPDMKAAGWGRIINISSSSAQSGSPYQVHYSASKGAMIAMTRSLAQEVGPLGITVNNVPPGSVMNTKMSEANSDKFGIEVADLARSLPMRRTGVPDDIAAACAWLASEHAGYVTGQTIGINGGRIMS